jgi:hypothetical protein
MGLYFLDAGQNYTLLGLGAGPPSPSPYQIPRFAFDGFVIDHLSVGGSLAVWTFDPHRGRSFSGVLLAPRVGYAFAFNDTFGFWPRGGFSFWSFDHDDEFALTLEAIFYASPVEHFAFTFGPTIDIGIAGDSDFDRQHSIGIVTAGIMGWI